MVELPFPASPFALTSCIAADRKSSWSTGFTRQSATPFFIASTADTTSFAFVIAMNGVSGRMGYRQHLVRSILAIREQGGVLLSNGDRVQLEPILVGRREAA